jgi:hypothetical protein
VQALKDELGKLGLALLIGALLIFGVLSLAGCVTRVQVCGSYDRRLGRENESRYARDSAGGSVCADLERQQ